MANQTANKSQSLQFLHLFRIFRRILLALLLLKTIICIIIRHWCVGTREATLVIPLYSFFAYQKKDISVKLHAYVRVHLKTITILYIYIYIIYLDLGSSALSPNNLLVTKIKKLNGTHGTKLNFNLESDFFFFGKQSN